MKNMGMRFLLLMAAAVLLSSCQNKKDRELEEEVASGVVLIQNKSYYEVELSDGSQLYFSNYDEDDGIQGLSFDLDSVQPSVSFGTGFFISQDGKIATNSHVVSNTTAERDIRNSVGDLIDALKDMVVFMYNDTEERYEAAYQYYRYAAYSDEVSYSDYYAIRDVVSELSDELEQYRSVYKNLNRLRINDTDITYHTDLSIAYNDTHVTGDSDLESCVVLKNDADHDLAILQLKHKETPSNKYIFIIPENDPLEEYTFLDKITTKLSDDKNSHVHMTSFNLGPIVSLTNEGIKSQFNSGNVSQRTDDRILYSIPALPGSSGSPVINQKGELIAINNAGLRGTQGFNYGIRVKHLRRLLND